MRLLDFFGLKNGSTAPYLFWSGIGSDISEIAVIGAAYTFLRKHNCHVKGCWRIGHFSVDGTPFITCKHHHPNLNAHITADHVWNKYKKGNI